MDPLDNPYRPGAGTPPPALLGRDALIDAFGVTVRRAVSGMPGKSLMPIGLRGVGKTVLLNRFGEIAGDAGMTTAFIEAPETGDFRMLLAIRIRKILLGLERSGPTRAALRALRVLKTFALQLPDGTRVAIDVDALAGEADSGDLSSDLTDLLVATGEAAGDRSAGLLLAIDEVQYLKGEELSALISAIHRTTQLSLPVTLVGAGLPQLPGLAGEAKSYAERLFDFPLIGSLDDEDARGAIAIPAQERGAQITDGARGSHPRGVTGVSVLPAGMGVPRLERRGGLAHRRGRCALGAAHRARSTRPELLPRPRRPPDPRERDYLRAMAELGPGPHRSGDIAATLGVKVESVAPRRSQLISKGMIFSPAHGDTAFTVPLFDDYLRRTMPTWTPPGGHE